MFKTVYELLDHARDRPGMYGIGGKSFRLLQSFLAGLSWGNLDPGEPSLWDFEWWAAVYTDHFSCSMPMKWLSDGPDEEAYETWFKLLDEFRQCRVVELARLPGTLVQFSQHWTAEPGGPMTPYVPPTPQAIRIGQFAPSKVFFLEQIFPDHEEKLIHGYQPAIERTIEAAQQYWKIDPAAWKLDAVKSD